MLRSGAIQAGSDFWLSPNGISSGIVITEMNVMPARPVFLSCMRGTQQCAYYSS